MAPNLTSTPTLFIAEAAVCSTSTLTSTITKAPPPPLRPRARPQQKPAAAPSASTSSADNAAAGRYPWQIVWRNVAAFVYLHYAAFYGLYLMFSGQTKFLTIAWMYFLAYLGGMGITAGAHRLWAHRAYKAKWPLRFILMLCQSLAFQNHIYEWVRDHRVHHKFTDTDADPHNASRGFFFSHMGWLMLRKHPDVRTKGAGVDMSDLKRDPIVMFQKRFYVLLMPVLCFVIPAWLPVRLWGESGWTSWYVSSMLRYTLSLHGTWLVNSAAHIYGNRPIDKTISPTESAFVAHIAFGEGWHNYHHVFPWDYKAAELGTYKGNWTTAFIDLFARIGWAYDLKTVSKEMVEKRVKRTGDGSHRYADGKPGYGVAENDHHHHHYGDEVWGWGDKDMSQEDIMDATIIHKVE